MTERKESKEPRILKRGKEFHARVQQDWELTAKNGKIDKEHTITISQFFSGNHVKHGRLDLLVNELGDYVSIVEIKSTDWDKVKVKNRKKLVAAHCRQVWKYIEEFLDVAKLEVCAGLIYPKSPITPGLKKMIEEYLNRHALQVVWYDDKN